MTLSQLLTAMKDNANVNIALEESTGTAMITFKPVITSDGIENTYDFEIIVDAEQEILL